MRVFKLAPHISRKQISFSIENHAVLPALIISSFGHPYLDDHPCMSSQVLSSSWNSTDMPPISSETENLRLPSRD